MGNRLQEALNMAAHKVVCWDCGCDVEDPFVNTCPKYTNVSFVIIATDSTDSVKAAHKPTFSSIKNKDGLL